MEVRWSSPAAKDLERIFKRIQQDNPKAARAVVKSIYDGCATLKDFQIAGVPDTCQNVASYCSPVHLMWLCIR